MDDFGLKYQYTQANQRYELKVKVTGQIKESRDEALKRIDQAVRAEIKAGVKDSILTIQYNQPLKKVEALDIKDVALIPDGPILEHFTKVDTTWKICQIIQKLFEQIEYFIHSLTGQEVKRTFADFELLASLVNEYPEDGKLKMKTALSFYKKQLENEKGPKDVEMIDRLGKAEKIADQILNLRGIKSPTKAFKALVKEVQEEIKGLKPGKKMLIPLSYQEVKLDPETKKSVELWHEFVLEVEGKEGGKCAIRLISNNPKFQDELASKTEGDATFFNLFHTQDNIDIAELAKRMEPLMEVQVWDRLGFYNSRNWKAAALEFIGMYKHTIDNTFLFKDLLCFEGSTLVQSTPQEWSKKKAQGSVSELMVYLKAQRPLDYKYLEVASHLQIFLKIVERNNDWLKKEEFRGIALASINKLLIETYENRALLFGLEKKAQEKGIQDIVNRLKGIKERAEKYATKDNLPIGKSFSKVLEGDIQLPEAIQVALEATDKKEEIVSNYVLPTTVPEYDRNDPVATLKSWNERCETLLAAKEYEAVHQELILMAEEIPLVDKEYWNQNYTVRKNVWKDDEKIKNLIEDTYAQLNLPNSPEYSSYNFYNHMTLLSYQLGQVPTNEMNETLEKYCADPSNRAKVLKLKEELADIYKQDRDDWVKAYEENNKKIDLYTEQLNTLIHTWFVAHNKTSRYKAHLSPQKYLALQTFSFILFTFANNFIDPTANGMKPFQSFNALLNDTGCLSQNLSLKEVERLEYIRRYSRGMSMDNETSLYEYGKKKSEYYKANEPGKAAPKLNPYAQEIQKKGTHDAWSLAAFCDTGTDPTTAVLPKPLAGLNRLSWLLSLPNDMRVERSHIFASPEQVEDVLKRCTSLAFTIAPYNGAISNEEPKLKFNSSKHHFFNIEQNFPENYEYIEKYYDSEIERIRVLEEVPDTLTGKKTTNGSWTKEESRDISSCNHNFMEDRYHQLLNVFSIHPQFYGRPECQKVFNDILFRSFSSEFLQPQNLKSFIEKIPFLIDQFKRNNDVRASVFILQVADTILRKFSNSQEPEIVQLKTLLGPKGVIGKLNELANLFKDPDHQRLIHMQILNIYNLDIVEKKIKPSELQFTEIFKAYLLVEAEPGTPKLDDPCLVFGAKQVICRLLPLFKEKPDAEKVQIVNALMKDYTKSAGSWQLAPGGFPGFVSGNQYLDLSRGIYLVDGKKTGRISSHIRNSALFEEFFKDQDDMLCSIELQGNKFVYTPLDQPNYKLVLEGIDVHLYHKIKVNGTSQWCQYLPTSSIAEAPNSEAIKGPTFWNILLALKDKIFPTQEKKKIDAVGYIKEAAIGNKDCWRSVQDPQKIFVSERDGDCVASLTVQKKKDNQYNIVSWTKATGESLLNTFSEAESLKRFSPLEQADHILNYGKGTIDIVEFPRLTVGFTSEFLKFRFTKENRVELVGSRGYYLSESDEKPGNPHSQEISPVFKPGFKNYMFFKNRYSEQKVIIAGREIEKRNKGEWETMLTQKADKIQMAFEFDVDQSTNLLRSTSDEGNLYLAYLHLAQKDYLKAIDYLKKGSPKGEISPQYVQILKWIRKWPDDSFNANVLKLHLEVMLEKLPNLPPQMRQASVEQISKVAYRMGTQLLADPSLRDTPFASYLPADQEIAEAMKASAGIKFTRVETDSASFNRLPKEAQATKPKKLPGELSSLALTLWAESDPTAAALHPDSFDLAGREWIIHQFFAIADKLAKLDIKSAEYKSLLEAVERFTPNMENDSIAEATKRIKYEEAKFLLLRVRDERNAGKDELARAIADYKKALSKLGGDNCFTALGDAYLGLRDLLNNIRIPLPIEGAIPASRWNRVDHFIEGFNISLDRVRSKYRDLINKAYNSRGNYETIQQEVKKIEAEREEALKARELSYPKEYFGSIYEPMTKISQALQAEVALKPEVEKKEERKSKDSSISDPMMPVPRSEILQERVARLKEVYSKKGTKVLPQESPKVPERGPLLPVEPLLSAVTKEPRKLDPKAINKIFNPLDVHEEPSVQELAAAHRKDLEAFLKTPAVKIAPYTKEQLENLKAKLESQKASSLVTRDTLYGVLTHVANKIAQSDKIEQLKRELGYSVNPSVDLILGLYEADELDKLEKYGVKLTAEEKRTLEADARQFLLNATFIAKIDEALRLIQQGLEKGGQLDEIHTEELHSCLTAKRCYDEMKDPLARDLLMMEYKLGILLRPEQKDLIETMLRQPNRVRQLKMGDGKTMVILPFLAKRKTTGKNLVAVLFPKELYQMGKTYLSRTAAELWNQKVYGFEFDINTPTTEESLLGIQAALLETIVNEGFIVSTKESFLSFKHTFISLSLHLVDNPDPHLFRKVQIMAEILKLLRNDCDVIADEVDSILDVIKEVNFSIGEQERLDPLHAKVSIELMRQIFTSQDPRLKRLAESLRHDAQATLTADQRTEALETLAREMVKNNDPKVVHYMMGRDDASGFNGEVPPFMQQLDVEEFNRVATIREFISKGFNESLKKSHSTTVGYGRDSKGVWTIPFAKGQANIGSEIYLPVPRVCATLQDYVSTGVTFAQIKALREEAMTKAQREIQESWNKPTLTIDDTAAGKEFIAFLQKMNQRLEKPIPETLQFFKTGEMKQLQKAINLNPLSMMDYCEYILLPRMQFSPIQIPGTPYDLLDMVHNFAGFSGTPWNIGTYKNTIDAQTKEGVEGQSYQVLLEMNPQIRVVDFEAGTEIETLLEKTEFSKQYHALIDLGGYLKGKKTIDFVEAAKNQAHEQNVPVKGYMYVDENTGDLVYHPTGAKKPVAHTQAQSVDPVDRKSIYVQAATTGTDITQDKEAVALVTIGEQTFIRDLFQAIWRLRKLDKFQKVEFLVSEKIKNLLTNGEARDLQLQDILRFCIVHQGLRVGDDNLKGDLTMITGAVPSQKKQEAVDNALSTELPDYANFINENRNHYIRNRDEGNVYQGYAKLKKEIDPRPFVQELNREAKVPLKNHPYRNKVKLGSLDADQESFVQMQTMVQTQVEQLQELSTSHLDLGLGYRREYDPNFISSLNAFANDQTHPFHKLNLELFDPQIYLSNNLTDASLPYLIPRRFPSYEVMIGRDASGTMKALLVSVEDQGNITPLNFWKARISNDPEIYHGDYLLGPEREEFNRLYVQAKVLSGFSFFVNEWEQQALKAWLDQVGAEALRKLYEEKIYPILSPERQEAYKNSQLRMYLNGKAGKA